jgi:hypothetical protein
MPCGALFCAVLGLRRWTTVGVFGPLRHRTSADLAFNEPTIASCGHKTQHHLKKIGLNHPDNVGQVQT